jgi:hypothetical protein
VVISVKKGKKKSLKIIVKTTLKRMAMVMFLMVMVMAMVVMGMGLVLLDPTEVMEEE